MTNQQKEIQETTKLFFSKESVASRIYFSSLYFVTVGVLYLWGYWSEFKINILEYLELSDILKTTAYPIALLLILALTGSAIGQLLVNKTKLVPGGGRNSRTGLFLYRYKQILFLAYCACVIAIFLLAPVQKWIFLPMLVALPIIQIVRDSDFFIDLIPSYNTRTVVSYIGVMLPLMNFGNGILTADNIKSGKIYTYIASNLSGYPSSGNVKTQLRLIGHAGDFLFLFDPKNSAVVMMKFESGAALVLMQHSESNTFKFPYFTDSEIKKQ